MLSSNAFALSSEMRFEDAQKEQRAREIFSQIRCVVCSGESIKDSNADIAASMRRLIRNQIKDGASDEQIIGFFQDKYGDEVLMKPPFKNSTYLLWIMPLAMVLIGILVVTRIFFLKEKNTKTN